jgi:thiol-disulfide isomerase/thioredoxin
MKKITILIVLAMLCLNFSLTAQRQPKLKALAIGDPVPASANLGAYQGKLLILDFWATWCAPCRAMVPQADSLNKVFKGQALILPVTYETEKVAGPVLGKLHRPGVKTPEIFADNRLRFLFPHRTLPHYVWIDPKGVVRAITEAAEVNATVIRAALATAVFPGEVKVDVQVPYDKEALLLIGGNGGTGNQVRYHSMLSGYIPGIPGGMYISKFDPVRGQTFNIRNVPLVWLFRLAYKDQYRTIMNSRIRILSKDSAAMASPKRTDQTYTYELHLPPDLATRAFPIIKSEIERLFPQYDFGMERVKTRCLALVRTGPDSTFIAKGKLPYQVNITPFECTLQNAPLNQLMMRLESQYLQLSPYPLVDETAFQGRVDIHFSANLSKPAEINRGLEPYGLALVEKHTAIDVMVVRDRPLNHQP